MKKLVFLLLIGLFTTTSAALAQDCQFEEVYTLLKSARTAFDEENGETGLELVAQAQSALQPCVANTDCPVSRLNALLTQITSAPANSRSQILNGAMALLSTCGIETSAGTVNAISLANIDQLQLVSTEFYPDELRSMIEADVFLDTDEWLLAGIDFNTDMYILRHTPGLGWAILNKIPLDMGTEFASGVQLSDDRNTIYGGISYYLFVVDAEAGTIISKDLVGSFSSVMGVVKIPDGSQVAVAVQPNIIFYDTETRKQGEFFNLGTVTTAVAFHPNGQQLAVATFGIVSIFDLKNYGKLASLEVSPESVMQVMFLEQTNRLLTFDLNSTMSIWDLDTYTRIIDIPIEGIYPSGAVVSLAEDMVFIPSRSGITIVDLTQNQLVAEFADFDLTEDMEGPGIGTLKLLPGGEELLGIGYSATYLLSVAQ